MSPSARELRQRDYADALWSRIVRARDGWRCRLCGSGTQVEAAHIIGRGHDATRLEVDNGLALCRRHHREYDQHVEATRDAVVVDVVGQSEYDRLRRRGNDPTWRRPPDWWSTEHARLRRLAREMGVAA